MHDNAGPNHGGSTPPPRAGVVSGAATPPKSKRAKSSKPKKPKIRTYCRRKAEIEELLGEMARLKSQMKQYAQHAEVLKQREALMQREATNQKLRDVLHMQRLTFASSLSMVSQVLREKHTGPFDTLTHLPKDRTQRHVELLRMKQERIQRANEFMRERQRFMDVSTEYCDQKKFEATNGDLCTERFEVVPLPEARSVKAIIDALESFVYNIEISISEVLGDITVRENDDPKRNSSVAQHRLVTTVGGVVQMDTNNVAFTEYSPAGPPGSGIPEVGLSISDAVDEDEVFPYHPKERVRQDVTVIIMAAWRTGSDGKPLIVLSRWWCLRIRKSDIFVPPYVVERIQSGMSHLSTAMMIAARNAGGVGYRSAITSAHSTQSVLG